MSEDTIFVLIEIGNKTDDSRKLHSIVRALIRTPFGHSAWPEIKRLMKRLSQMSQHQAA